LYAKIPQIIVHGVEFISPQQFAKVYNLNNHDRCPKSLKVPKDLEESEVETLFTPPVNKNGYKYMECGDPKFIALIKKSLDDYSPEDMASNISVDSTCHGLGNNL
jgi:hypothetical protein